MLRFTVRFQRNAQNTDLVGVDGWRRRGMGRAKGAVTIGVENTAFKAAGVKGQGEKGIQRLWRK